MPRERLYVYPETEYTKAIRRLGWSQVHAGQMLGIDPRTSRRYASGDLSLPNPLQMLLRVLVNLKRTDEWFVEVTGREIK